MALEPSATTPFSGGSTSGSPELVFGKFAADYIAIGLPVFPTGPDKAPLIRTPQRIGCRAAARLASEPKFACAGIGMRCGARAGLTVVDIDEPGETALSRAIERFGRTPLIVRSHSGKHHLYFKFSGERRRIKFADEPVDILGEGGHVVLPPSVGEKGRYAFLRGGFDQLRNRRELPTIKSGALDSDRDFRSQADENPLADHGKTVEGHRDERLFRACLAFAAKSDTLADIEEFALAMNATFIPPLTNDQARRKAVQAWGYKEQGRLMVPGGAPKVLVAKPELEQFRGWPLALQLWLEIKAAHGADPGKVFALGVKSIAATLQCHWRTAGAAIEWLIERRKIERLHVGGRCKGDASRYRVV